MKRFLFFVLTVLALGIAGCEKESDYNLQMLYGTWDGISVCYDDEWYDVPSISQFTVTFLEDGTYSRTGYFGTGSGTYTISDEGVIVYIDGSEFARYKIVSLSNNEAEMVMRIRMDGGDVGIRFRKR